MGQQVPSWLSAMLNNHRDDFMSHDWIEPRTLGGQQAREHADTCAALFDEARLWV